MAIEGGLSGSEIVWYPPRDEDDPCGEVRMLRESQRLAKDARESAKKMRRNLAFSCGDISMSWETLLPAWGGGKAGMA